MPGRLHDRGNENGECRHVRNSDLFLQKIRNAGKTKVLEEKNVTEWKEGWMEKEIEVQLHFEFPQPLFKR